MNKNIFFLITQGDPIIENPSIMTIVYLFVGSGLGLLGNWLVTKNNNKTTIEVATIDKDHKSLINQLEEALKSIDEITKKLERADQVIIEKDGDIKDRDRKINEQDIVILEYKGLLKHFKVLVSILSQQLPEQIKNSPENMVVINHLKQTIENFKY